MHYQEIINMIKARRAALQVTQEDVAKLSGVSLRTIKQIEAGKGNPTLLSIQKIADVLGMEVCLKVKTPKLNETGENTF